MADAKGSGWTLRRLETAVALAGKVGRPLTFFAAMGFILIATIPIVMWAGPNGSPVPSILSVAVIADIICVLIWAKAKLKQDQNAFKDE